MKLDVNGQKVPEYGLMPPGVIADWNRFAHRFFMEGNYCAGMLAAARALADIDYPDGAFMLQNAEEFREEILRAYRWTQARSPVLPLSGGTWIPAYPAMLYCFGQLGEVFPGEDWNRSWAGDVETGAHHLAGFPRHLRSLVQIGALLHDCISGSVECPRVQKAIAGNHIPLSPYRLSNAGCEMKRADR